MDLVIDETSRQVREFVCECCGGDSRKTWAMVNDRETPVAVYYATCYHHHGIHEVWLDAIVGTWGSDDFSDHLTFGCRIGPVQGSPDPAATLVDAAAVIPDAPIYGQKLTREAGLAHPRLADFWNLVDHVLANDGMVNQHLYGRQPGQ
jgi:hypothetical protein